MAARSLVARWLGIPAVVIACATALNAGPQSPRVNIEPAPSRSQPSDDAELNRVLDQLRSAIRNEDWNEAWRLSWTLSTGINQRRRATGQVSPELELAHVELMAGRDATTRTPLLPRLARTAYAAHNYGKAESYAVEALEASKRGAFWWTGDAIHDGNLVLGRLSLQRRDTAVAGQFLLAAGKTPGSSNLASTGPGMALARDLLKAGEKDVVIAYLEECRSFWKGNRGKLAEWLALVRAGLLPDFGPNAEY